MEKKENIIAGIVGSFLGSLVGVTCIVGIGQLGYISSFSGLIMAVCVIKGYERLGGRMSRKGAAVACFFTLIMTYFGNRLDFAVSVARLAEVDIFLAFQSIGELLDYGYLDSAVYWGNLALLYLFTLMGGIPTLISVLKNGNSVTLAAEAEQFLAETDAGKPEKINGSQLIYTLLPFGAMFVSIGLIALSICPWCVKMIIGDVQSVEALLKGYGNWYLVIIGAVVIAVLLVVPVAIISFKRGIRSVKSILLIGLSFLFPILFGGIMVMSENIPGLISQVREDIEQIENDQLREVTVWLSPKSHAARFPGPYSEGQPELLTRYGGISTDTEGQWVDFYVPDYLDFSLDQDALYNENESIDWNEEHARQYRLRVTDNFSLVVSAEPVEMPSVIAQ